MDKMYAFGGEMPPLDEGPEYDDFNDETFGDMADAGDWEGAHEKLAQDFGDLKPLNLNDDDDDDDDLGYKNRDMIDDSGFDSAQKRRLHEDELEKSMTQFVLDDDDEEFFDPAILGQSKQSSRPIPIGGGSDANMSQLFGPSSPPSLFNPTEFMSPAKDNIWGSPRMPTHTPPTKTQPRGREERSDQLKAILNIGGGGDYGRQSPPLEDAAIVKAVSAKKETVFTLEELERDLTSRAPPRRTKSPILGSPPPSGYLPIGTPPRHQFMHIAASSPSTGMMAQSPVQQSPMSAPRPQQQLTPQQVVQQSPMVTPRPPQQTSMSAPRPQQPLTPQQVGQQSRMDTPRPPQQLTMSAPRPQQQLPQQVVPQSPMVTPRPPQQTSMSAPRPQQQLPPQVIHNLTQQIVKNLNGRVSPTHVAQLIMHMHNISGRVSPNQITHKLMMQAPPMSSSPGKPPPRMMHPGMRPPPPPMMPFSPGGPGRMPHPHTPPGGMPHPRGRPPPMGYMHGLTPMNPRIPPMHARTDPGPRGRYPPNRYPPNQYNSQNRNRMDPRQQRPYTDNRRNYDNNRRPDNRGPRDEYANLMNQREKDWVIKIQMLQLQSNNPNLDDYYYQTYMQRKKGKDKDQNKEGVQPEDKDNGKDNAIVPQPKLNETRTYQPTQFAGALGRLTSSSVNNPRQIIDIQREASTEDEEKKAKDHSRRRRVLLSIERVYSLLLQVDDLEKQVLALPESDRALNLDKKQKLVTQMYTLLKAERFTSGNDHFVQVLSIRKGRKLISRVLPYLDKEQALMVIRGILQNFSFLLKREMQDLKKESPEETLPHLYPPISNVVKSTNLAELTSLVHSLMARQPGVSPNRKTGSNSIVTSALQNKFGVSVVLSVLNQGEEIHTNTSVIDIEQDVQFQWVECVNQVASDICVVADTSISEPLRPSCYDKVLPHFARFVSKQSYNALDRRLRSITTFSR